MALPSAWPRLSVPLHGNCWTKKNDLGSPCRLSCSFFLFTHASTTCDTRRRPVSSCSSDICDTSHSHSDTTTTFSYNHQQQQHPPGNPMKHAELLGKHCCSQQSNKQYAGKFGAVVALHQSCVGCIACNPLNPTRAYNLPVELCCGCIMVATPCSMCIAKHMHDTHMQPPMECDTPSLGYHHHLFLDTPYNHTRGHRLCWTATLESPRQSNVRYFAEITQILRAARRCLDPDIIVRTSCTERGRDSSWSQVPQGPLAELTACMQIHECMVRMTCVVTTDGLQSNNPAACNHTSHSHLT